jgi:hypothetical protein
VEEAVRQIAQPVVHAGIGAVMLEGRSRLPSTLGRTYARIFYTTP